MPVTMQVLLTAATPFEVAPTLNWLEKHFRQTANSVFEKDELLIFPLITGVGAIATAFHIGQFLAKNRPDLAIDAGIAGSFDRNIHLGDVLNITTERFGDLGVEEADGRFTDLFELGLLEKNTAPYSDGLMRNPAADQAAFLPAAQGLTVNKVHGTSGSIAAIRAKYPDAQVESMEGAAFFYACLSAQIPFLEIRSISNYVEVRNREAWDLPLAIHNLNQVLTEMFDSLDTREGQPAPFTIPVQ